MSEVRNHNKKVAAIYFDLKILFAKNSYGVEYEMYTLEVDRSFQDELCNSGRIITSTCYREKEYIMLTLFGPAPDQKYAWSA